MKKIIFLFSFLILISFSASGVKAQSADDMKKWMDAMTPGDMQKGMAKMAGEWTYTSKLWMAPGQEPMVSSGTAKYEMLLDLVEGLIGSNHKAVVFSQYTKMLAIMREDLQKMGVRFDVRQVVNGDDFQFSIVVLLDGPVGQSADAPEPINTDFCYHAYTS